MPWYDDPNCFTPEDFKELELKRIQSGNPNLGYYVRRIPPISSNMYERFTDRARKVFQLANQTAQHWNHEYIGTEHLLIGLLKSGGVACNVLINLLGRDALGKIEVEVCRLIQEGPDMVQMGKLPQTPRAKKCVEYAMEEARNLNHNYVGSEHILLGLLREDEGVAGQVLMNLGLNCDKVRHEMLNLLGGVELEKMPAVRKLAEILGDLKENQKKLGQLLAELEAIKDAKID